MTSGAAAVYGRHMPPSRFQLHSSGRPLASVDATSIVTLGSVAPGKPASAARTTSGDGTSTLAIDASGWPTGEGQVSAPARRSISSSTGVRPGTRSAAICRIIADAPSDA